MSWMWRGGIEVCPGVGVRGRAVDGFGGVGMAGPRHGAGMAARVKR